MSSGTLFVVATPIGNLEDLTFRALRTLREVGLIAAEDTRRTAKLLAHYEIRKSMVSLREHNEVREAPRLVARIQQGLDVALVSDAGTPGIADPGARLVVAALAGGIRVVPIPGPSAVAAALSACGASGDAYVFLGFPPATGTARKNWMAMLAKESRTQVLFEAPHRIQRTLSDMRILLGNRQIKILRELTKINENLVISDNNKSDAAIPAIGEFVVVIPEDSLDAPDPPSNDRVFELYEALVSGRPVDDDDAVKIAAGRFNVEERVVRKIIKKAKILADQQNRRSS